MLGFDGSKHGSGSSYILGSIESSLV